MFVVIDVDTALAEEGIDLRNAGQSSQARLLYEHLRGNKTALIMFSAERDKEVVKLWLMREGFGDYVSLYTRTESVLEPEEWKVQQLKDLIAEGRHLSFFLSGDSRIAGEVAALGVTQLIVVPGNPVPGRKASVDVPYKTWDHLTDIIEDTHLRKAKLKEKTRHEELPPEGE